MGLFGKSQQKDPNELVKEWSHKIRKEGYQLDRQVRSIRNEEEKVKRTLKQAALKGDKDTCTILAKEIVHSRKAVTRIYLTKAHLNSVQLQMKNQLATLRVAGSLEKSTEVMVAMQNLVRLPEVAGVMRDMSKEMMKAGIIEEMLEETMDSIEDTDELEEEVQSEVDKVLFEITEGKLGVLEPPPTTPAGKEARREPAVPEPEEEEEEEDMTEMQSRLQALRS